MCILPNFSGSVIAHVGCFESGQIGRNVQGWNEYKTEAAGKLHAPTHSSSLAVFDFLEV